MLIGNNEYALLPGQMKLDKMTLQQVAARATAAWRSLPEGNESTFSFSNIKQKPEEPYEDFLSRLTEVVNRVISNSELANIETKQLAFENANSTCQAILHPVKKTGILKDYIRQCADIGPSMMQGVAIDAAMKGNSYQQTVQSFFTNKNNPAQSNFSNQRRDTFPKTCFSCDQEGHVFRTCPQKTADSYQPNSA